MRKSTSLILKSANSSTFVSPFGMPWQSLKPMRVDRCMGTENQHQCRNEFLLGNILSTSD